MSQATNDEIEEPLGEVIAVDATLLARYLTTFRKRTHLDPSRPQKALDGFFHRKYQEFERAPEKMRSMLCRLHEKWNDRLVELLENPEDAQIDLHVADLAVVAHAYHISPLMLVPLLTSASNRVSQVIEMTAFEPVPIQLWRDREKESRQTNSQYRRPKSNPAHVDDVAIVQLHLETNSRSDLHAHPGDEIVVVMSGEVALYLDTTGTLTTLTTFSYAHFYAEQLHGLINVGSVAAEVLIVRFYQFETDSVRAKVLESLRDASRSKDAVGKDARSPQVSEKAMPKREHLAESLRLPNASQSERLIDEVATLLEFRDIPKLLRPVVCPPAPEVIVDRHGLGRFLKMVSSKSFRGSKALSLREIAKDAKERSRTNPAYLAWANKSLVSDLHEGSSKKLVCVSDLPHLAELYGVADVLLYDFLFPAVTNAVVVRCPPQLVALERPEDGNWPWDYWWFPTRSKNTSAARYGIPRRRLANSDLACALLHLEARAKSPENRHPGWEMLVPLRGNFRVTLDNGDGFEVVGQRDQLAHYPSGHLHQVEETAGEEALALVLRFYHSSSSVTPKSKLLPRKRR